MVIRLYGAPAQDFSLKELRIFPTVCVQIPLYNEKKVARRVIEAVAALEYPKQRIEVQVLDDSNDETSALVDDLVLQLQAQGQHIRVLRRKNRSEYKAGALRRGLQLTDAEFVAIFDADFIPEPRFLKDVLAGFHSSDIGFVQARWGFVNRNTSLLTRAQAILLDAHFLIDHPLRMRWHCFNFNGTAGVWRVRAIHAAGGWQGDSVTEDLDLSYRMYLAGWRACYLKDVICMSELPDSIDAFKSQQYRWMKGSAQVLRKLSGAVLTSQWSFTRKCEALFHLASSSGHIFIVVAAVLLVPSAVERSAAGLSYALFFDVFIFLFSVLSMMCFYGYAQRVQQNKLALHGLLAAVLLGVGITAHCARAALAGLCYNAGEFVRTPKRGSVQFPEKQRVNVCLRQVLRHKKELCIFFYLVCGLVYVGSAAIFYTLPFGLLILSGYALVLFFAACCPQE